jgi:serine/threonine protein phosphatase 1
MSDTNKQYIAIGDIHGCFNSTKALLEKLEVYPEATLIFIGDYIDRGPQSMQVVDFLIEYSNQRECIFLRGNHEQMLLDAVHRNESSMWIRNGGDTTMQSYNLSFDDLTFPESHMEFYDKTKLYFESETHFFVHAGVPIDITLKESISDPKHYHTFLWGRDHINAFETPWEKTIVFGHTPMPNPIRRPKMLGIDTGCVYNKLGYGKLTAVVLPEEIFIQQVSLDH